MFLATVLALVSSKPNKILLIVHPKATVDWDLWDSLLTSAAPYTIESCTQKHWIKVKTIHGGTSLIYLVADGHLNRTIGKKYDNVIFLEE